MGSGGSVVADIVPDGHGPHQWFWNTASGTWPVVLTGLTGLFFSTFAVNSGDGTAGFC